MPETELLPLSEALSMHHTTAGRVTYDTGLRWCRVGLRTRAGQLRLECQRIGGRVYVTLAAITAFLAAVNDAGSPAEAAAV